MDCGIQRNTPKGSPKESGDTLYRRMFSKRPRIPGNFMGDNAPLKGRVYHSKQKGAPCTARPFGASGEGEAKGCSPPKETPLLPAARCSAIAIWEGFLKGRDPQTTTLP